MKNWPFAPCGAQLARLAKTSYIPASTHVLVVNEIIYWLKHSNMHLFGYLEIYFFISLFRITIQSDFGLKFCMVFVCFLNCETVCGCKLLVLLRFFGAGWAGGL